MAKSRDPFELRLSESQRKVLGLWLCDELQRGIDARATAETECDYWHSLYEQARTRLGRHSPWPDAADLTSYLASEKVDALQARLLRSIWVDPIWTVEGWGDAAERAPFVEEFHQWKAEEERLQSVLDRLSLISLIEPRGLLEISEGTEMRPTRKTISALPETDPLTGGVLYGEDMAPMLKMGRDGKYVEAKPGEPAVETVVDSWERVRTGPVYRILPYRDSVILPGHARDEQEIWAYGKRFWRQHGYLKAQAAAGLYDADSIEKITATSDRESDKALERSGTAVAPTDNDQAEKELWEVLVLVDLASLLKAKGESVPRGSAGMGPRWYLLTVHLGTSQLLRVQYDDLERSRFVPVILFPRPDRATEGFSFVGHKLITTIEEHTAWRNMAADRAALVVQAPIKRLIGAMWEPEEQPWGPRAVIDVQDMNEVQPVQVPDYTGPAFQHLQMMERTAERIAGVNDIASGQIATEQRTLGEVQMATANSAVRMDIVIRRFQETMETIGDIRHAIWKRTLASQPEGIDAPISLVQNLEGRGVPIDQFLPDKRITAALLDGAFRFKPRGSVETADPQQMRQDWVLFISQALPMLVRVFPMLLPMFQTPQAARAMARQALRLFKVENTQAFLGSPANDLMQAQMPMMGMGMPGMGMQPGMMPGQPMMPPGAPPQAPPMAPPPQAGGLPVM